MLSYAFSTSNAANLPKCKQIYRLKNWGSSCSDDYNSVNPWRHYTPLHSIKEIQDRQRIIIGVTKELFLETKKTMC